jgi:hypothetical protein
MESKATSSAAPQVGANVTQVETSQMETPPTATQMETPPIATQMGASPIATQTESPPTSKKNKMSPEERAWFQATEVMSVFFRQFARHLFH